MGAMRADMVSMHQEIAEAKKVARSCIPQTNKMQQEFNDMNAYVANQPNFTTPHGTTTSATMMKMMEDKFANWSAEVFGEQGNFNRITEHRVAELESKTE